MVDVARSRAGAPPVVAPAPASASTSSDEIAIAPPPETFDAPAAAAAPPPIGLRSAATSARAGGVWAVVIGIDDYPGGRSDLRSSVRDADDVDAALDAYGIPGDRRLVLRNTQASAAVIGDSLRWLVAHAGADATAVFFYAGHIRKLGTGREAIVAADGRLVTDVAMADLLRPLVAGQTWIALAACYAGGFDEVLAPGRILTGAAPAGSVAYENAEYGNSYLVEYMVDRAMREGRAPGSVEQSYAWAYDALRREHPNRMPVQYDRLDGELRLGAPPPAAPSDPPSTPAPAQPPPTNPPQDPPNDDGPCLLTIAGVAGCDDRAMKN